MRLRSTALTHSQETSSDIFIPPQWMLESMSWTTHPRVLDSTWLCNAEAMETRSLNLPKCGDQISSFTQLCCFFLGAPKPGTVTTFSGTNLQWEDSETGKLEAQKHQVPDLIYNISLSRFRAFLFFLRSGQLREKARVTLKKCSQLEVGIGRC